MTEAAPSVVGYELTRARELLAAAGWQVAKVEETRPPAPRREATGPWRVVQQRPTGGRQVVLVVARQFVIQATPE